MNSVCLRPLFFLTAALVFLTARPGYAAPLSGTKSIGPTGDYATVGAAIAAIQAETLGGSLVLELQAGYDSSVETFPLVFANLGASSVNTVTLRPELGAATLSITSADTTAATVDLNGAAFLTIDGRPGGVGTASQLEIANTSTSGVALRFINEASDNTIRYVTLRGVNTSATSGVVVFGTTTGANGNDNNTLDHCDIGNGATSPVNAVYALGTTTTTAHNNSGNTLSNCNVFNFFSAGTATVGVLVGAGNTDWTLTGNRFFQTPTRTYTTGNTHRAIQINNSSGNNFVVSSNTIGYADAAGTGTYTLAGTVATRFIAIDLSVGTTTASSVQGNTVTAISLATSSGATTLNGVLCGINISAGTVNVGTVTGNTLGGSSGVNLLAAVPTTSGGMVVAINSSSTSTIVIQGNTIGGLSSSGTTASIAGSVIGINVSGAAASMTISGNTIGNSTTDNMRGGTSGLTTGSSLVSGISLPSTPTTAVISNNTIQNLASYGTGGSGYVRGIWTTTVTSVTSTFTISGNTVAYLKTTSSLASISSGQCAASGIHLLSAVGSTISGNTIHDISANNTGTGNYVVAGISLASSASTGSGNSAFGNRIYGLSNAGTGTTATAPPVVAGISIRSGNNAATRLYNNMIALGAGQTANTAFIGIWGNHGSSPHPSVDEIYFNTIHISGTATSGALPSFGFERGSLSATAVTVPVDLRNNLIVNTRSGGTGKHYALANNYGATASATGWGASAANYNVLNADAATVGYWSGDQTFANWKTASAGDANSLAGITVSFVDAANGNLHLTGSSAANNAGTAITGLTTDYDGDTRSSTPSIGADENGPLTVADSYTVAEGGTLSVTDADGTGTPATTDNGVLVNDVDADHDPLTAVLVTPPAHHSGTFTLNANGTFTYVHDGSETTSDSFTYKSNDGTSDGNTATVTITVTPVNDNPVANTDSLVRPANASAKIAVSQVLANDTDPESDTLSVTGVNSPSANGATITKDGIWLIYEPPPGFNSTDSFTYNISDGHGGTAIGTVTVTIAGAANEQTKNIVGITASGADMIVRFAGIAGRSYRIETTADLTPTITWTTHPGGPQTAGANGVVQLTDVAPPSPRFYRAVEE